MPTTDWNVQAGGNATETIGGELQGLVDEATAAKEAAEAAADIAVAAVENLPRTPYDFGAVLDGDLTAPVTNATDDTAAIQAFFAWLADGSGKAALWPAGKIARVDQRITGLGGNYSLEWGAGSGIDYRNLPNLNGSPTGSVMDHAGAPAATVAVSSITSTVDGNKRDNVTIVTSAAHGLAVGDDFLLYSDDPVDIGHDPVNETRGQMCRVRSVTNATTFVIEEPLFQTLPTNPKLDRIAWVEDVIWTGSPVFVGPGRRAGSYTDAAIIGYSGPSWTYARRVSVPNVTTIRLDYQSLAFDQCVDFVADGWHGEVDPEVPGSVGAIQYGLTAKNACTRGSFRNWSSFGYRHAFDHTRNSRAGVARDLVIDGFDCAGTWREAIGMHGNARDCVVQNGTIRNCYDGIGIRAPGWKVRNIIAENVRIGVSCTDNPAYLDLDGLIVEDAVSAVRMSDANYYIGSRELGSKSIQNITARRLSGNAIDLDASMIPAFTEADSAVASGTTTSMTVGALNLLQVTTVGASGAARFSTVTQVGSGATGYVLNVSGSVLILQRVTGTFNTTDELVGLGANSRPASIVTVDMFNASGALSGAEVTVDPDGAGTAVAVVRIATHTHSGGANTFTWSTPIGTAVTTAATYKIRTLIDAVRIENVMSEDVALRSVQIFGNFRNPVISNVTDNSATVISAAPVWLRSNADNHCRAADVSGIRTRNKALSGRLVDIGAENVGTRVDGDFRTRAELVAFLANGGMVERRTTAGGLQYDPEASATDIPDLPGLVPAVERLIGHYTEDTDISTGLASAVATGEVRIPPGNYTIGTAITLANDLTLIIDRGATITVNAVEAINNNGHRLRVRGGGKMVAGVYPSYAFRGVTSADGVEFDIDGIEFEGFFYAIRGDGNATYPIAKSSVTNCVAAAPDGQNAGVFFFDFTEEHVYDGNKTYGAQNSSALGLADCLGPYRITNNIVADVGETVSDAEAAIQIEDSLSVLGVISGNVCPNHDIWVSGTSQAYVTDNVCRRYRVSVGNTGGNDTKVAINGGLAGSLHISQFGPSGTEKNTVVVSGVRLDPARFTKAGNALSQAVYCEGSTLAKLEMTDVKLISDAATYALQITRAAGARYVFKNCDFGSMPHSIGGSGGYVWERGCINGGFKNAYIRAGLTIAPTMTYAAWTNLNVNSETYDVNAEYSAGVFTATEDGEYLFDGLMTVIPTASGDQMGFRLHRLNNTPTELARLAYLRAGGTGSVGASLGSVTVSLNAGDEVALQYFITGASSTFAVGTAISRLNITRVS